MEIIREAEEQLNKAKESLKLFEKTGYLFHKHQTMLFILGAKLCLDLFYIKRRELYYTNE